MGSVRKSFRGPRCEPGKLSRGKIRNLTSTSNSEIYPTCDSVKPSALIGSQFLHLEKKFGLSNDLFSIVISI